MNWKTEIILIGGGLLGAYAVMNYLGSAVPRAIGGTINAITAQLPPIAPTPFHMALIAPIVPSYPNLRSPVIPTPGVQNFAFYNLFHPEGYT